MRALCRISRRKVAKTLDPTEHQIRETRERLGGVSEEKVDDMTWCYGDECRENFN